MKEVSKKGRRREQSQKKGIKEVCEEEINKEWK